MGVFKFDSKKASKSREYLSWIPNGIKESAM